MSNVNNNELLSSQQNELNINNQNSFISHLDVFNPTQLIIRLQSILQIQLSRHFNSGDFVIDTIIQLFVITFITYMFTKIPMVLRFIKKILYLINYSLKIALYAKLSPYVRINQTDNKENLNLLEQMNKDNENIWEQQIYINTNGIWQTHKSNNTYDLDNVIINKESKDYILNDIEQFTKLKDFYNKG